MNTKQVDTAQLQMNLIRRISEIKDKVQLEELLNYLNFQSESIYVTTVEEKQAIYEAQQQIVEGETETNEDVQNEMTKWLCK